MAYAMNLYAFEQEQCSLPVDPVAIKHTDRGDDPCDYKKNVIDFKTGKPKMNLPRKWETNPNLIHIAIHKKVVEIERDWHKRGNKPEFSPHIKT